uniref:NADH-ubiquinone oxidoreductase chain 4 n=1 Tax=Longidorus vineacola TaxID=241698 RepID=A0A1P8C753_9BILA|nr:NADH dehydrogenase subunit 4 [Longidorus vineacola]AOT84230.1 NADH dehydrogenase subunit 4 [Longidorus vineacola]
MTGLLLSMIGYITTVSNLFSVLDLLSSSLLWLALGSSLSAYLCKQDSKKWMWWATMLTCSLCFMAWSLFLLYVMFEMSLIPIFMMILYWGAQPERLSASVYFLLYTSTFSLPFLSLLLIFNKPLLSTTLIDIGSAWMLIAAAPFLVKMPTLGLHFWLPKAHVEASTSGSMILAGLLLKLGAYGLFRVLFIMMSSLKLVSTLVMLTLLSSVMTLMQSDSKKLIAYSSVTHMTFLAIPPFGGTNTILFAVIMMSLAHGWASSGMFMLGGTMSHAAHSRSLHLSWGPSKMNKLLLMVGGLLIANASIPPAPSFFSEVAIVQLTISLLLSYALIFIVISLLVCYYNVLLFLYYFQVKCYSTTTGSETKSNSDISLYFNMMSLVSLTWLSLL